MAVAWGVEREQALKDFWLPASLLAPVEAAASAWNDDDFWLPFPRPAGRASAEEARDDFWLGGLVKPPSPLALHGPAPGMDSREVLPEILLPWFEGGLAIRPAPVPAAIRTPETMAQRRARWLVQLLDEPLVRRRESLRSYFTDLFAEFPTQQTFRALAALAVNGGDGDTLRHACEFKRWVLDDRLLLARRVAGGDYFIPQSGNGALISWARCYRLATYCGGDDPADHFERSWFDDWVPMAPGESNSPWFIDYFEQRLRAKQLGYWDVQDTAARRTVQVFSGGIDAWCRSTGGQLVYGAPDHVGVFVPPSRGLVVAHHGRIGVGTTGHRLLG